MSGNGQRTIAILGAGKLGAALLSGLLRGGHSARDLIVTGRRPERCAELTRTYGVRATDARTAATEADVLVVAVKPQDAEPLLADLAPVVRPDTLVVSLCAGVPAAEFERKLTAGVPVVRVMPNIPMLVGAAISAISPGTHATAEHLSAVEQLLGTVGEVVRVPESQQDAVTALSGSGPAYFFFLAEAMIDAGTLLGLPREVAAKLVVGSAVGAAAMLSETGEHPATLREAVTSPAGTTVTAIRELEKHGVRAALLAAIEAARDRSQELGEKHLP
jgi:pyrroline-5-carboxylate reductase